MPAQRPYQCYLRMNEHDSEGWRGKAQLFLDVLYRDVLARIGNLRAICDAQHTPNGANVRRRPSVLPSSDVCGQLALGEYFQPFGALKQEVGTSSSRTSTSTVCSSGLEPLRQREVARGDGRAQQGQRSGRPGGRTDGTRTRIAPRATVLLQIKALMDAFSTEYQGPCINHRCSPISVGAWLRIQMISKDGGDFTSLPGVVKHEECKVPFHRIPSGRSSALRRLRGTHARVQKKHAQRKGKDLGAV